MGKNYAPRVAIVGGGVSGLVAGASLSAAGLDVSLFDTGENATGGRMSSRQVGPWEFDHSTQYFTVSPGSEFSRTVEEWEARGWVTRWPEGAVGVLSVADSQFSPLSDGLPRYIGVDGFTALCEGLAAQCTRVVRPQWVGAMSPAENTRWNLSKSVGGRPLGDPYDFVLIAHNGKCAARLAGTAKTSDGNSAASKVLQSLQCGFGVRPLEQLQRQRKLILSSIWVLMFVTETPLGPQWEGAHVSGSPTISWASNVTAKRRHRGNASPAVSEPPGQECWVVHSTPQFARDNKVPQENIPEAKAAEVTAELLSALESAMGLAPGSVKPVYTRVQLWGAANPLTVAGVPAVFDSSTRTGACGDWCEGPPCVEAAARSALAASDAIEALLLPNSARDSDAARRLDALRVRWSAASTASSPLGAFPGMDVHLGQLPSEEPKGRGGGRRGGTGGRGRGRGRSVEGGRAGASLRPPPRRSEKVPSGSGPQVEARLLGLEPRRRAVVGIAPNHTASRPPSISRPSFLAALL